MIIIIIIIIIIIVVIIIIIVFFFFFFFFTLRFILLYFRFAKNLTAEVLHRFRAIYIKLVEYN